MTEPAMCRGRPCPLSQGVPAAEQSLMALGLTTSDLSDLLLRPPLPEPSHSWLGVGCWQGCQILVPMRWPTEGQGQVRCLGS